MDVPLLVFGSCLVLLGAVIGGVGVSYQPEATPLIPAQPHGFGVLAKSVAGVGALLLGLGAFGFGGFVAAGVGLAAIRVARL